MTVFSRSLNNFSFKKRSFMPFYRQHSLISPACLLLVQCESHMISLLAIDKYRLPTMNHCTTITETISSTANIMQSLCKTQRNIPEKDFSVDSKLVFNICGYDRVYKNNLLYILSQCS